MGLPGQKGRLPYLQHQRSKSGCEFWYVRKGRGKRIRIHGKFGSDEFMAAYSVAIGRPASQPKSRDDRNSISFLVSEYRLSCDFQLKSSGTRYQREFHLKRLEDTIGNEQFGKVTTKAIQDNFDRRKGKASQARHWLDTMKALFRYAKRKGLIAVDPTEGVDARIPKRRNPTGFAAWTEADILAFENRWKRGTRERLMFDILLYTGLRRGDAHRLGPQHVHEGAISLRTEKTDTEVTMHVLPPLKETLDAGPTGVESFVATEKGTRMTKESFANAFRSAAREAGIRKPMHGMRKAAAIRAAEAGATANELQALFGWSDHKMAAHYTKNAERKGLGLTASSKLARSSTVG